MEWQLSNQWYRGKIVSCDYVSMIYILRKFVAMDTYVNKNFMHKNYWMTCSTQKARKWISK